MRHKTLLIATLLLGVGALVTVRLTRETPPETPGRRPLVEAAALDSLRTVAIKANNKSVTLEKTAAGWTVKEKLGLPADLENRFLPLVRGLQKAGDFGLLTANAKRLEKLGLTDSVVTLTGADGKTTTLGFGKQTEDGLGASVRRGDEKHAIRTDFTGYLEADPMAWADLTLFSAKPAEIKSIALEWKDGKASFARKEVGALFEGKEGQTAEDIIAALATVRAADALPRDDKSASAAGRHARVTLGLVDGASVVITLDTAAPAKAGEPGRALLTVAHSDSKHQANAVAKLAIFVAAPWMVEQVPASLADFRKGPASAEPAPQTIQIPGPSPAIITSPDIKVK
jgi:hypothetical protein